METEHQEQVKIIQWAESEVDRVPELALLYAVPNGGHRHKATAARLSREGVKAGVPDLVLPVPRSCYHGLYIELKRQDRKASPTKLQRQWLEALADQGYASYCCRGADAAITVIEGYLEGKL